MSTTDIIILIVIGLFAIRGFFRGIIREFFLLLEMLALVIFVFYFVTPLQILISESVTTVNFMTALIVGVLGIILILTILRALFTKIIRTLNLSLIDRSLGFIAGIFLGLLFSFLTIQVLLFIAESFQWTPLKNTVLAWINQSLILQESLSFINSLIGSFKDSENTL